MIFIELCNDNKNTKGIHYQPFHPQYGLGETEDQLRARGKLIDELPPEPNIAGKYSLLMYDEENDTFYWELFDRPLSQQEELEKLKAENSQLKESLLNTQNVIDMILMGDIAL